MHVPCQTIFSQTLIEASTAAKATQPVLDYDGRGITCCMSHLKPAVPASASGNALWRHTVLRVTLSGTNNWACHGHKLPEVLADPIMACAVGDLQSSLLLQTCLLLIYFSLASLVPAKHLRLVGQAASIVANGELPCSSVQTPSTGTTVPAQNQLLTGNAR